MLSTSDSLNMQATSLLFSAIPTQDIGRLSSHNRLCNKLLTSNLGGLFITHPLLNFYINQYPATYYKLYAHAMISQQSMDAVQTACIDQYNANPNFDYLG